jgi:hypothetical protein
LTIKKIIVVLLFILLIPAYGIHAQTGTTQATEAFDTTGFPQWAKDLRRWEIVAFGTFPFSMLFATTAVDMVRWNNANGMSFSDMRYAPWPLKSAGAIAMSDREMRNTIQIAVGLSAAFAFADLIIVKIKQNKERKRAEALPVGTTIITRTPLPEEPGEGEGAQTDEPDGDTPLP